METQRNVQLDYKKWILFNNKISHYQHLYDLYRTINSLQPTGEVIITEIGENGDTSYLIQQPGVVEDLVLNAKDRTSLLEYLYQNYFASRDVDTWYKEKSKKVDKENNHHILTEHIPREENQNHIVVQPHRKEIRYYRWKLLVSIMAYTTLLGLLAMAFLNGVDPIQSVLLLLYLLIFWLVQRLVKGFFVGHIKGNAVRVSEEQYPKIYEIVKSQAASLKLKELPQIYISYGHFNAFVMQMARSKYLMLYSEVVETSLTGSEEVLKFVIGHELGHIYRKHLTKDQWLFPAKFIPFLQLAYSRGREYTCDRIGYHFSRQGAVEGILILAAGKEIYSKINVEKFLESGARSSGFWVWFSEKFLTHPHLIKRLQEIKNYNRSGN